MVARRWQLDHAGIAPPDIYPRRPADGVGIIVGMSQHFTEQSQGMHVIHDGPPQSPPLLLIHGSGAAASSWNPVVPMLSGHHHVIRVDLPGHGRSPSSSSYAVTEQAGRVAALLDELGLDHVIVAGHSSGGYIATALAQQRRDLVSSLALISTGPSPEALLRQPAIVRMLTTKPIGPLLWALRSDAVIRKGISATCHSRVDIDAEFVAGMRGLTYRTFTTVLRENGAYIADRSVPERLTALDVPVLAVFGDSDPRWDPTSVYQYDTLPRAHVTQLPAVGHMPMLEAPEATARLLLDFAAKGH
ncbi:Lipase 3 [Stackebrandtia soli]